MLKNKALKYYKSGNNCSQCILKACNDYYKLNLPNECYKLSGGVSTGFGAGSICSVLVACVMIISYMYPEDINSRRIKMLDMFSQKFGSINCSKIRKQNCENIISKACDILEDVLNL